MAYLGDITNTFHNWGFYDFVFPFLLFSAIIFAILNKTKLFHTKKMIEGNKVNPVDLIISLVASFYVVSYTPAGTSLSSFLTNLSGNMAVYLSALLGIMILMASVGFDFKKKDKNKPSAMERMGKIVLGVSILFLIVYFITGYNPFSSQDWTYFIVLIIIVIVILLLAKPKEKKEETPPSPDEQNPPQ